MAVGTYQGVAGLAPRLFALEEETGSHHGHGHVHRTPHAHLFWEGPAKTARSGVGPSCRIMSTDILDYSQPPPPPPGQPCVYVDFRLGVEQLGEVSR